MKYYIVIDYGISTKSYGRRENTMSRTGQGNSVLRAICRDTSYIIFSHLERKNLGAIINFESKNKQIQRVAIVFADDTDFYSNKGKCQQKCHK